MLKLVASIVCMVACYVKILTTTRLAIIGIHVMPYLHHHPIKSGKIDLSKDMY